MAFIGDLHQLFGLTPNRAYSLTRLDHLDALRPRHVFDQVPLYVARALLLTEICELPRDTVMLGSAKKVLHDVDVFRFARLRAGHTLIARKRRGRILLLLLRGQYRAGSGRQIFVDAIHGRIPNR